MSGGLLMTSNRVEGRRDFVHVSKNFSSGDCHHLLCLLITVADLSKSQRRKRRNGEEAEEEEEEEAI